MPHRPPNRTAESGSAAVEFAFCCLVIMPLLMGLIAIGFALVREMQVTQVCRDAGHMYAKGVDFSTNNLAARTMILGTGSALGLTDPAQTPAIPSSGAIILTTIMLVTQSDCVAGGYPSGCTNQGYPVITNQILIGDPSVVSTFGTFVVSSNPADYLTNSNDRASNFPSSVITYWNTNPNQSGQLAYISEVQVTNHAFDWTGFVGSTVASISIF